jgi:hypothetical protein
VVVRPDASSPAIAEGPVMRLSGGTIAILIPLAALAALGITGLVMPAPSTHAAEVRPWLVARATGITAYLLLAADVALGTLLSHPENRRVWKLSKRAFPWHEQLAVFVWSFLALHVVLLAVDRYAHVGWLGAFVPGLAGYRPIPVALGTIAAYALLVTSLTARWTRILPGGWWVKVHRLSAVAFLGVWLHAVLAGTDSGVFALLYLITGLPILASIAHRLWTQRLRPVHAGETRTRPAAIREAAR